MPIDIFLKIRNTGKIAGAEVVQVYLQDIESSVERPIKELKGF
jgi:beta-glucosidase